MRVTKVSYGFTKNLGNFQSQRVDATVVLGADAGDNFDAALELATAVVHEALDMPLSESDVVLLDAERERATFELG